jgi:hypothetical protein
MTVQSKRPLDERAVARVGSHTTTRLVHHAPSCAAWRAAPRAEKNTRVAIKYEYRHLQENQA